MKRKQEKERRTIGKGTIIEQEKGRERSRKRKGSKRRKGKESRTRKR
jgi:hypothetical protein